MGMLLFLLLVLIVLALIFAAGGYSVRHYWSPADSEVVEAGSDVGAVSGIAAATLGVIVLVLLIFGFSRWNWFGTTPAAPSTTNAAPIATPLPAASTSRTATPSPSPSK